MAFLELFLKPPNLAMRSTPQDTDMVVLCPFFFCFRPRARSFYLQLKRALKPRKIFIMPGHYKKILRSQQPIRACVLLQPYNNNHLQDQDDTNNGQYLFLTFLRMDVIVGKTSLRGREVKQMSQFYSNFFFFNTTSCTPLFEQGKSANPLLTIVVQLVYINTVNVRTVCGFCLIKTKF